MKLKLVYETLSEKNFTDLQNQTGISRQSFYNFIKNGSMRLSNFTDLLESLNIEIKYSKKINSDTVLESLCYFGAPVGLRPLKNLDLETALSEAILLSSTEPIYETLIPYVIAIKHKNLNTRSLLKKCIGAETERYLAYYVEMAYQFGKTKELSVFLKILSEIIYLPIEPWISLSNTLPNQRYIAAYEQNTAAFKWKIWAKGDLISHIQRWEKWNSFRKK